MVRTVFAILSIALLSACGLKGSLYMPDEQAQSRAPQSEQQTRALPADDGMPSDNILPNR